MQKLFDELKLFWLLFRREECEKVQSIFFCLILCSAFSPLIFSKAQGNAKEETTLFFFYSPYCSSCQQAEPIVEKLEADGLAVEKYNIQDPGSLSLMMQ